jgi:hypothetical protein
MYLLVVTPSSSTEEAFEASDPILEKLEGVK